MARSSLTRSKPDVQILNCVIIKQNRQIARDGGDKKKKKSKNDWKLRRSNEHLRRKMRDILIEELWINKVFHIALTFDNFFNFFAISLLIFFFRFVFKINFGLIKSPEDILLFLTDSVSRRKVKNF